MKLWLAPLHGITQYYFRNVLCRHVKGIDAAIAPFIPVAKTERTNVNKWKDLLPENNKELEVIPQLMGNIASDFLDTVAQLSDLGYNRVNWNLGCPMKQIVKRKRGCGLMPFPDQVEEVVSLMTAKSPVKLSLKIRLGLHSIHEGELIVERMNAYPLDFIILHPRLGEWLYTGKADSNAFGHFLHITRHPLYYNGDITDMEKFSFLQKKFPVLENWVIGRGLLQNPFLAEQIKESFYCDSPADLYRQRFADYYRDLTDTLLVARGERGTLSSLKELWHYFAVFWDLSAEDLVYILRINDLKLFLSATDKIMLRG